MSLPSDEQIAEEYQSMSLRQIATKYGSTPNAVLRRLVRAGVPRRSRGTNGIGDRPGRKLMPEGSHAEIAAAYIEGSTLRELAEHYGRGKDTIKRVLLAQNVTLRPRGRRPQDANDDARARASYGEQ